MTQLFIFLLVSGSVVAWWHLMQGRQRARKAAGQVCSNHGLQLLDDTVSLSSITWNRKDTNSRLLLNYGFEFATNGAIRRSGVATMGFPATLTVTLDLEEGRLIETLSGR